jgi:N6-adenosine-specific RNA methylase IME4
MKTKDILSLPVIEISDHNSHLYLWVTNNFLKDGLNVMEAWGFRYITMITWVKDKMGLGQYFRGMTEHCLFGVRGNLPYAIDDHGKRKQGKTVFFAPRTQHSVKPNEMRLMIEKVSPSPRIELFSRCGYKGWDHLGNAQDGKDIHEALNEMIEGRYIPVEGAATPPGKYDLFPEEE